MTLGSSGVRRSWPSSIVVNRFVGSVKNGKRVANLDDSKLRLLVKRVK